MAGTACNTGIKERRELTYAGQGFKVTLFDIPAAVQFEEHTNPSIEIAIPFENAIGPASWQSATGQNVTQTIHTGHTSVLPANLPHWGSWHRRAEVIVFYLESDSLYRCAGDAISGNHVEVIEACTAEDPFLSHLANNARARLGTGNCPLTKLYAESVVISLSTHILTYYRAGGSRLRLSPAKFSSQELQLVIDYTYSNLSNDLSLAVAAQVVQRSSSQFARLFKRSLNRTYYQYVLECRVAQAQQLLRQTTLHFNEIAQATGFFDQSHLTNTLRRMVGTTPSAYRSRDR